MDAARLGFVGGAALVAGAVNAIAGGGSLFSFPALVLVGLPDITASFTNTVALCPGYLGATLAQRRDLVGQRGRALRVLPFGAIGGAAGALLLLYTSQAAFKIVVPFLLLIAALLLAFQDRLRRWLVAREHRALAERWAGIPVGIAAVYGGYFGAGMGVIVLAALAVALDDDLIRINALKQTVSLVVNVAAAIVFVAIAPLDWEIVGIMAGAGLVGGLIGGALASRIPADVLRWIVVAFGLAVSAIYFVRL